MGGGGRSSLNPVRDRLLEVGDRQLATLKRHADVAQLVEHHLAKVRVAGSNPVVRSKNLGLNWVTPGESSSAYVT